MITHFTSLNLKKEHSLHCLSVNHVREKTIGECSSRAWDDADTCNKCKYRSTSWIHLEISVIEAVVEY